MNYNPERSYLRRLFLVTCAAVSFLAAPVESSAQAACCVFAPETAEMARQISYNLPRMVDRITRMDSAFGTDNTLTLHHTVLTYTGAQLANLDVETVKEMEDQLIDGFCSFRELHPYFKRGLVLQATYKGRDGRLGLRFLVRRAECRTAGYMP